MRTPHCWRAAVIEFPIQTSAWCRRRKVSTHCPLRSENFFTSVLFKLILQIDILRSSCDIGLSCVPWNPIDDKSILVQVMAWCHQAESHYLSQCWPSSKPPYGITRPQWVLICKYKIPEKHIWRSSPRLQQRRISTTCATSKLRNSRKCEYNFF